MEIKKILWPTDFSGNSEKALPYVRSLTKQYNAHVHILYVIQEIVHPKSWYGNSGEKSINELLQHLKDSARKRLAQICEQYRGGGFFYAKHIAVGDPAREILNFIKQDKWTWFSWQPMEKKGHFQFGSVCEKVMKKLSCPCDRHPHFSAYCSLIFNGFSNRSVFVALKPTIYKIKISLSDIDQNHYDSLNLTIAQHPSETQERMMARILAFCLNARENLAFTKGLSAVEEPDIWARTLDDRLTLWIDIGEPSFDRIKKASRLSPRVKVYSFNLKSDSWWAKEQVKFADLAVSVFQFNWKNIQTLTGLVNRTMDLSITFSDNIAYVSAKNGECEVACVPLQSGE